MRIIEGPSVNTSINYDYPDGYLDARDYGVVADNVTDNTTTFVAACTAALAANTRLLMPDGKVRVGTPTVTPVVTIPDGKKLRLFSLGECDIMAEAGGSSTALDFKAATIATGLTLTANVAFGDRSVNLSSTAGVLPGHLIFFSTNTAVDSGYSYKKQMVMTVGAVSGSTVYLSEPSNFDFTTAETAVSVYGQSGIECRGVNWYATAVGNKRINFLNLTGSRFYGCKVRGTPGDRNNSSDPIFINACQDTRFIDIDVRDGRYPINVSNASRNTLIDGFYAENTRHMCDANTWAWNTVIRNGVGVRTTGTIESHPAGPVHFENVVDYVDELSGGTIGLRSIGGSVKKCTVHNKDGVAYASVSGPLLLAAYQYIGAKFDRVYEDVNAPNCILSASDVRDVHIRRCTVSNISIDGASSSDRISGTVYVTPDNRITATELNIRRVAVADSGLPLLGALYDEYAPVSGAANTSITGITQANPPVVTAAGHGLTTGDVAFIAGVTGMTQVNKVWYTVTVIDANTISLNGADGTAWSAYTSGGKVTKGSAHKTLNIKRVIGAGNTPTCRLRGQLRKQTGALGVTSITYPVKIRSIAGIQEIGRRTWTLTVTAFSTTRGVVKKRYQGYFFTGSTSSAQVSAAQDSPTIAPSSATYPQVAIANLRPHFYTQVNAEGADPNNDMQFYALLFDLTVTMQATGDNLELVEVEYEETQVA